MTGRMLAEDLLEALDFPPDRIFLFWEDETELSDAERLANQDFRAWRSRHPEAKLDFDLRWREDVVPCR